MKAKVALFIWLCAGLVATSNLSGADPPNPGDEPKDLMVEAYDSQTNGAVQVRTTNKKPVDFFDVLKNGERAFGGNPKLLNNTIELPPGTYEVDVNRSRRKITVEAGKQIVLWTGELVVEGKPNTAFWYPMQGDDRKVATNPPLFNRPLALLPGKYTVYAVVSTLQGPEKMGDAEVKPAKKTALSY